MGSKKRWKKGSASSNRQRRYPVEYKLREMRLYTESGYTRAMVAEELGVGQSTLASWAKRYREEGVEGLETRGRSNTITAGFVVHAGRLTRTEVLVYRERKIRLRSFTRQFDGASLTEGRRLDRRIDGITGATISVKAMQNLARVALYLNSVRASAITGSPSRSERAP